MPDTFFSQQTCDRCGATLTSRIMSWFNSQTICLKCSMKENIIKRDLRANGKDDLEGCGYIPIKGKDY